MQIYKGLPIITNKISEDERDGVPHHIFDQIGLEDAPWLVTDYQREARKTIRDIQARGRLPILVGGTHYYAESVLFNHRLQSLDALDDSDAKWEAQNRSEHPILEAPTSEILDKLREVDPEMASRWHPSDRRKIARSLEIWLQTGVPASQVYHEQSQQRLAAESDSTTSNLAYPSLILWLRSRTHVLKQRLDSRVEEMVTNGLLDEARSILNTAQTLTQAGRAPNRTRGIWVSIGAKEMESYFNTVNSSIHPSTPDQDPTSLEKLKQTCITNIKTATQRYARYQTRWLLTQLAQRLIAANSLESTLFVLDTTDPFPQSWEANVFQPAEKLTRAFLARETPVLPTIPSGASLHEETMQEIRQHQSKRAVGQVVWGARHCEACDKTLMTEREWVMHVQGKGHRRVVKGREKKEQYEKWKREKQNGEETSRTEHANGQVPETGQEDVEK